MVKTLQKFHKNLQLWVILQTDIQTEEIHNFIDRSNNYYLPCVNMEGYIGCCFFTLSDISATMAPIGVKFCMMVHISPRQIFSPSGGSTLRGTPKSKIVAICRKYLENGKSQCYMSIRACRQFNESFVKCKSWGNTPNPRGGGVQLL